MTATRNPASASCLAVVAPAGPPPITITSNRSAASESGFGGSGFKHHSLPACRDHHVGSGPDLRLVRDALDFNQQLRPAQLGVLPLELLDVRASVGKNRGDRAAIARPDVIDAKPAVPSQCLRIAVL